MSQIKQICGKSIPLKGNDIDTDRIIPARFLRCVTFDGLGEQAFADDRLHSQGKHPFDLPQYQDATILIVNANFGCGSSREHAPQALAKWGIKAIIGESFAEIFFGNCLTMGIPCVTADSTSVTQLQDLITANPEAETILDLEKMEFSCGNWQNKVTMGEGARQMLITGIYDSCGQLVANSEAIKNTVTKLPYLAWK